MFPAPRRMVLPEWPEAELAKWNHLAERTAQLTRRAGTGAHFGRLVAQVRRLLRKGQFDVVDERLRERRFARALVNVWHEDESLARVSLTASRLAQLVEVQQPRPSTLTTLNLIAVLLKYFDELDDWREGLLDAVGGAVIRAVQAVPPGRTSIQLIETVRHDVQFMIDASGPSRLAQRLVAADTSLVDHLRFSGLLGFDSGRFGQRLRHGYYIAQIQAANHIRGDHGFLREITSRLVTESPAQDGLFFGHELLRALVDKPDKAPSDEWLEAILEIGGDPRLQNSAMWRKWWQPLPANTRRQATRWMSVEDLRLFLLAVESFGREEGIADLSRLFPPRKKFLWGLYDSGKVKETRLILGDNVRKAVRNQLGRIRTDAATLKTLRDTAVIYVDCEDFHLVEGSHHFKLWIYAGRPAPALVDRSKRTFTPDDLRVDVPEQHAKQHPHGTLARREVIHRGLWQRGPLEFLIEDYGIYLDPAELLTSEDYYELKHKFGLPVHRYRITGG